MNYTPLIRRIFAALFLLLFTFSVTPKKFLHDFLANHKDIERSTASADPILYTSGFQCHCDDLVVMAPFLPEIQPEIKPAVSLARHRYAEPLHAFVFVCPPHTGVRGPPADFCS